MDDNKRYYWLKLKSSFFEEKTIKYLKKMPSGDSLVVIYLKLLCASLATEGYLIHDGIMPCVEDELALLIDEDEELVKLTIDALISIKQAELIDNETLYLNALSMMIGKESDSAERVRKYRERKKTLQCNGDVTTGNACVTDGNTEIDIEKEKEIEIETEVEKEKSHNIYQQIADMYNDICMSFPKIKNLSNSRKTAIKARLKKYTTDDFRTLFEMAEQSSFLKGSNNRDWSANFDWLIKDANMAKVLDGNYTDKKSGKMDDLVEWANSYDYKEVAYE